MAGLAWGTWMADVLPNIFERLQTREAREEARRQAVWRWVFLVVSLLSWAMMLALVAPAIVTLFREEPWSNGLWIDRLRHTPLPTITRWLGWVGWIFFMTSNNSRLFFRSRENSASKLDAVLIVMALSCWALKLSLERGWPWAIGIIAAYFALSWFGARVWPGPPRKLGRLEDR